MTPPRDGAGMAVLCLRCRGGVYATRGCCRNRVIARAGYTRPLRRTDKRRRPGKGRQPPGGDESPPYGLPVISAPQQIFLCKKRNGQMTIPFLFEISLPCFPAMAGRKRFHGCSLPGQVVGVSLPTFFAKKVGHSTVPSHCIRAALGIKPTWRATGWPFLSTTRAGMLEMPNCWARAMFSSTSMP